MTKFERDLDALFGERIRTDDEFCNQLWDSLINTVWRHPKGHRYSDNTLNGPGKVIVSIRGEGVPMFWWKSFREPLGSIEIREGMETLGWSSSIYL